MDFNKILNEKVKDEKIRKFLENPFKNVPSILDSIEISEKYKMDIHPRYLFYWNELTSSELITYLEFVNKNIHINIDLKNKNDLTINFPKTKEKRIFEILGIEHSIISQPIEEVKAEKEANLIVIDKNNSLKFLLNLGVDIRKKENEFKKLFQKSVEKIINYAKNNLTKTSVEILNECNFVGIRDKGGTYIGARMGRPEKAKMRKQFNDETRSIGLFPVGDGFSREIEDLKTGEKKTEIEQNRSKNIIECLKEGHVEEEFRTFYCKKCNRETIYSRCEICKDKTYQMFFEKYNGTQIDVFYVKKIISDMKKLVEKTKDKIDIEKIDVKLFEEFPQELEKSGSDEIIDVKLFEKIRALAQTVVSEVQFSVQIHGEEITQLIMGIRRFANAVYYKKIKYELTNLEKELRHILGKEIEYPKAVKGISSTINKHHTTEHISKAFLRAINNIYVNKDGTIRYDMIEMGMTHTKPKEIGTSIKKLHELGYTHDYLGNPLENDEQIFELFPQDAAFPDCPDSGDEFCSDFIMNTGNYVDDLLEKLYGLPRFYNFKTKEDTVGHLVIGLAPHTSAGIVGRIIGYTKTQGCFSHPVWHAAQRRNLDGDENGIMLLLDGLINFSREYLPDRRGSRTMDVSLVLTSHLYLDQIDDEVHGMDIVPYYPLDFYKANKEYKSPKEVKIEKVDKRVNKEIVDEKYLGYGFTHTTDNMNNTILCSSYKSVPSMHDKLDLQLNLGRKLRAVDADKVGTFVIDKHFMKDIKGNLRKFSMQTFRCTKCNTKYRRPPLSGRCTKCGNASINFTIHEGSIKKYLNPSFKIIDEYDVDPYISETIELTNLRVEGVFGKEKEKQKSLNDFFGK